VAPRAIKSAVDARPRLRWSLVVAIAAHAGALGWTAHAARATTESAERLRLTELEVEVQAPPAEWPAAVVESAVASVRRETIARAGAHPSTAASAGPEGSSSSAAMPAPAPSAEPAGDGSWAFSPTGPVPSAARLSSAALDDAIGASVRATVAEGRTKIDPMKRILGGFTQHDVDLGLVPGGEFVGMTRDAVRTSGAPTVGHATLELQIDSAGLVASVHVLDASSDRAQWDEVAAEIAKATRGHVARVPSGARGFALKLEVTSSTKTASGRTPTTSGLANAWHAMSDPLDAVIDGNSPVQRVVAARIVDVHVL